ncbi:beta-microseminoprotein J1-like [Hyperolius riggenbachi]|uniref:beta-microseminoprotein J1-like n=1 Tax=Hyperolius riggenbachi TaxID=752182 RepID=UPI0035A331F2
MKYLVFAVVIVGSFLDACDASCFQRRTSAEHKHMKGCHFEGELHKFGSKWLTKDCWSCTCRDDQSVGCCSRINIPMSYDTSRCTRIYDMEACTTKLVSKEDPTKNCLPK